MLFGANLVWACAYPLYHFVLRVHIDPLPLLTLTTLFTACVALVSLAWDGHRHGRGGIEHADILKVVAAGVLIAVIRKGMLMFGMSFTSPVDGSIIATLTPVAVLIISLAMGVERFSKYRLLGILLGLAGAVGVILSGSSGDDGGGGHAQMWGNVMILGCSFISAIYMVWFKELLKKYDPATLMRWVFCVAAAVVVPIGFESVVQTNFAVFDAHAWLAVAYLIVLPTYLPNLLITSALQYVQPTVTSVYTYVQPTVAVAISVAMGIDKLSIETVIFGALLFWGVGMVIFAPKSGV